MRYLPRSLSRAGAFHELGTVRDAAAPICPMVAGGSSVRALADLALAPARAPSGGVMEQSLRSVLPERSVPGSKPPACLPAACGVSDHVSGGVPHPAPGPVGDPSTSRPIRVAIIDPYPLFRLGVVQSIARCKDLLVVGEGATLGDARRIAGETSPDIVIFDRRKCRGCSSHCPGLWRLQARRSDIARDAIERIEGPGCQRKGLHHQRHQRS